MGLKGLINTGQMQKFDHQTTVGMIAQEETTSVAPLMSLLSVGTNRPIQNTYTEWREYDALSTVVEVSGDETNSDTTITFADNTRLIVGTLIRMDSGEVMKVTAQNTDNGQCTVVRGVAGTTAAAIDVSENNEKYGQIIGTSHPEGSSIPRGYAQVPHIRRNETQIFMSGWSVTGTANAVSSGEFQNMLAKQQVQAAADLAMQQEAALLFGQPTNSLTYASREFPNAMGLDKTNGMPNRTMAGMEWFLRNQKLTKTGGKISQDWFMKNVLPRVFKKNIKGKPNSRIMIGDSSWFHIFNDWARLDQDQFRVDVQTTVLGLNVTTIKTQFGQLTFADHPMFNENPSRKGSAFIIHPDSVDVNWLRKRTELPVKDDGVDSIRGGYVEEMTMSFQLPQTGLHLHGFTGAEKSPTS